VTISNLLTIRRMASLLGVAGEDVSLALIISANWQRKIRSITAGHPGFPCLSVPLKTLVFRLFSATGRHSQSPTRAIHLFCKSLLFLSLRLREKGGEANSVLPVFGPNPPRKNPSTYFSPCARDLPPWSAVRVYTNTKTANSGKYFFFWGTRGHWRTISSFPCGSARNPENRVYNRTHRMNDSPRGANT